MNIKSDNQGFLVGELVESNKDLIAGQNTSNRLLGVIKTDVSAIARVLGVAGRSSGGRATGGNSRATVEPAGRGSSARNGASGGRSPGSASTAAQRTGGIGVANARATVSPAGRDSRGRFVAGAGGTEKPGGVDGAGGSRLMDKLGGVTDAIKGMASGADQMDPALAAAKEVKDVVEPIGRGAFAMLGRTEKQKKERWYTRIWKSLTNIEKKPAGNGPGGTQSIDGSDSTLMGGVAGMAARFLPAIIAGIGTALVTVLGVIGAAGLGAYIGTKIYEWLDKSGIATKIFDAFDAVTKWFKDKLDPVKEKVAEVKSAFNKGMSEQTDPVKFAPPVLDSRGRNMNDPRRFDRADAVTADGRMINDPRRLDAEVPGKLPPATSIAQSVGRLVGGIKQIFKSGEGYNVVERNDGSVVRQDGSRNWRNNNPGNIEYGSFARSKGAIGSDGRFAIFPDYDAGRKAKESLIFEGNGYKNLALKDAISRYAPPSENNTGAYQKSILASVGNQNKRMGDYTASERAAIMDAMQKVEGFRVGRTTTVGISATGSAGFMRQVTALPTSTTGVQMPSAPVVPMGYPSKLPAMPEVSIPTPSTEKDRPVSVIVRQPIGQNVSDRGIANVATGGIGATGNW
nr:hypothetical protein [uncultured Rhodoferax sp.]